MTEIHPVSRSGLKNTFQNLTSDELREIFADKASGMHDEPIKFHQLVANIGKKEDVEAALFVAEKKLRRVYPDRSATNQLLTRHQIPTRFYRRSPKWMQALIVNHYVSNHQNDYLLRYNSNHDEVRAILSGRYGIIDDIDLFKVIINTLEGREDIRYSLLEYDDHVTQLFIDFPEATGNYAGQSYQAGLCISNSETGHSSVWVEPIVRTMEVSFFNRRVLAAQGVDCRIIHKGKLDTARLANMVEKAKEVSQVGVVQLAEQFGEMYGTQRFLRHVDSLQSVPSRFVQLLEEEMGEEAEIIKAEAAKRILVLARELPLFQRITIQQDMGRMLGLFTNYQSRFADLAQEINNERVSERG